MITRDEMVQALPVSLRGGLSDEVLSAIVKSTDDPTVIEQIKDNFITFSKILSEGKYKVQDYLNAVMFVSYRMMDIGVTDSYIKVFPERYAELVLKAKSKKDISAYASAYNKNKLVSSVYRQSMIPIQILNQDAVQKAINTQVAIMTDPNMLAKDRAYAANSVLQHLGIPMETTPANQVNVQINNNGLDSLIQGMTQMVQAQQEAISLGVPVIKVAHQKIEEVNNVTEKNS